MTKPEKILYTATAKSSGGRDGTSASDDGRLSVTLSTPKSLGGNDGPGTNPEQMFAAGYSACFIGAMKFVAMTHKIKLPDGFFVEAKVGIGPIPGGFGLKVDMNVSLEGMSSEQANDIVQKAHGVCPYSNATRNNIEVNLNVHT